MTIETANRLVQLRKANGFSQEELALRLGISRQAVSKWERAESSPDTDNLIALAKLYGVSLDELLFESGGPEEAPLEAPTAQAEPEEREEDEDEKEEDEEPSTGSYFLDKERKEQQRRRERYPLMVALIYLCLGLFLDLWHPGWLIFLTIPLHYLPDSMKTPRKLLTSPVMITLIYLLLGFYFDLWHPGWIIFLAIPFFEAVTD